MSAGAGLWTCCSARCSIGLDCFVPRCCPTRRPIRVGSRAGAVPHERVMRSSAETTVLEALERRQLLQALVRRRGRAPIEHRILSVERFGSATNSFRPASVTRVSDRSNVVSPWSGAGTARSASPRLRAIQVDADNRCPRLFRVANHSPTELLHERDGPVLGVDPSTPHGTVPPQSARVRAIGASG